MMTARAVRATPPPAPAPVPAVASLAIHGRVSAPIAAAAVAGASHHAVWLALDDIVIVLSTRDATRLPNSIEVPQLASERPFERIDAGEPVIVGFGRLGFEHLAVDVVRWWDPRPVVPATSLFALAHRIADLPSEVPGVVADGLREALIARSPTRLLAAAKPLLGRGPGLTPEADDYLAGAIAATRILAGAAGVTAAMRMIDRAGRPLARLAGTRTTAFSATLIHHALRGQLAAPAGALLRAFAQRGEVATAHRRLTRVGHTSGPALAAGMVLGARALIEGGPR
jgi:hypothetical protein